MKDLIISVPGKFEGECRYIKYLWEEYSGNGFADATIYDEYERPVDCFVVDSDMIQMFPELKDNLGEWIYIFEDDQGFVYGSIENNHPDIVQEEIEKNMACVS